MRPKICLFISIFLLFFSSFSVAQSASEAAANSRSVVSRSLAAMSGSMGRLPQDAQASGTLTLHGSDAKPIPVTYKSIGSKMLRVELEEAEGTSVHILNNGRAVYTKAGGKPKLLLLNNTVNQRISHIPALLLGDETKLTPVLLRHGPKVDQGTDVIELSNDTVPEEGHCKHVSCPLLHLDRDSGFLRKLEYTNFAENNPNHETKVEIEFSDYRRVSGVWVPFKQVTFVDGEIDSELQFDSVQFDVGLSQSEFTLPEVKK